MLKRNCLSDVLLQGLDILISKKGDKCFGTGDNDADDDFKGLHLGVPLENGHGVAEKNRLHRGVVSNR